MRITDIPLKVRKAVWQRDHSECVWCGKRLEYGQQQGTLAHLKSRGAGGHGSEDNLVLLCPICHEMLDHTTYRNKMMPFLKDYIERKQHDN